MRLKKKGTTIEGDARAASHDNGARNAIEICSSRPSFGDVASGASHDIGARNAIKFFEVYKCLQMLRVSLVTILAREMHLEMGAVRIRHSIREFATQPVILWILLGGKPKWLPLNFGFNDVMRTAPIFWSRPTFGHVASGARHDIGAKNAIEIF